MIAVKSFNWPEYKSDTEGFSVDQPHEPSAEPPEQAGMERPWIMTKPTARIRVRMFLEGQGNGHAWRPMAISHCRPRLAPSAHRWRGFRTGGEVSLTADSSVCSAVTRHQRPSASPPRKYSDMDLLGVCLHYGAECSVSGFDEASVFWQCLGI